MGGQKNNDTKEKYLPKRLEWCPLYTAILAAIVSIVAIATGIFALVKFSIIESRDSYYQFLESNHQVQIDTLNTTISQYGAKISYLEIENQRLAAERDKYYNYLINIPESIYYFENIISELEQKNIELESTFSPDTDLQEVKYYMSYDNKKINVAVVDDTTGVVVCVNDIDPQGIADTTISLPGRQSEIYEVRSGDIIVFSIMDKNYQIIISMVSWVTNSYSIIVKEL